jgi:hypothetical protein
MRLCANGNTVPTVELSNRKHCFRDILALGKAAARSYLSQIGSLVEGADVKGQVNAEARNAERPGERVERDTSATGLW